MMKTKKELTSFLHTQKPFRTWQCLLSTFGIRSTRLKLQALTDLLPFRTDGLRMPANWPKKETLNCWKWNSNDWMNWKGSGQTTQGSNWPSTTRLQLHRPLLPRSRPLLKLYRPEARWPQLPLLEL